MRYLIQGSQTTERLELLLSLTRISSESVRDALSDYLVRGLSDSLAASANGVLLPNFTKALKSLDQVAATVEKIKEIDWRHLKSVK